MKSQLAMQNSQSKTWAILEAVAVFSATLILVGVFFASPLGEWERRVLQRFFLTYALMMAAPVLILAVARRDLAAFGISLKDFRYHLDVALTCFIPYSAAMALRSGVNLGNTAFNGLFDAVMAMAVLFILARLLQNKPSLGGLAALGLVWFLPGLLPSPGAAIGKAVSALVFYTFFLGPGEEILFRGYIQSRLNQAWGRPYDLFGARWGWGVIITSLLFGVFHVLNLPSLYAGVVDLKWWTFAPTFAWGLVFGLVREKTGSVVAPAILHGLPQGIAWAFLGL